MGRSRTLPIWVVPQAFDDHGEVFWWRVPTGQEGAVQIVLAFDHGAMRHCAWLASSATPDLLNVRLLSSILEMLIKAERLVHRDPSVRATWIHH